MSEQSQGYASLADLLQVARRRASLIIGMAVVCAVAAYTVSTSRPTTFTAESAIAYADPSQDLSLLGGVSVRATEPDQLAAAKANTITRPELMTRLRNRIGLPLSNDALAKRFKSTVEATSNLVVVTATAATAEQSAQLANGLAEASVASEREGARRRYRTAATGVRRRLAQLDNSSNDSAARFSLQEQLTRLDSLDALAQPASVARTAEVPTNPSAPKPLRSGVLAAFFGLFFGVGIAFVREALDRRVHGPVDIESLGLPVLASVRQGAMGKVARVGGVPGTRDNTAIESMRVLRTSLTLLNPEPKVVAVTSALPEEGKSTVAAALAYANAASGRTTLLLDCDLRRPSLAGRIAIAASPGLTDYMSDEATLEDILQTVPVGDGTNGPQRGNGSAPSSPDPVATRRLSCIMAGTQVLYPSEMLAGPAFLELLDDLRRQFDVIVIDTPPLLLVADTIQLLPSVDGVVLCVRAGQTTRDQALAGRSMLQRATHDKAVGVVATGVADHDPASYGYYGYAPRDKGLPQI